MQDMIDMESLELCKSNAWVKKLKNIEAVDGMKWNCPKRVSVVVRD
jgi:hypothetical protein